MDAKAGEQTYQGRPGQTVRRSIQVSGEGGTVFSAEIYRSVDVAADPELRDQVYDESLNAVTDPDTGQSYALSEPLWFHDPDLHLFALVIPESLRHREFDLRVELLRALGDDPEPVPDYVRRYEVAFGADALRRLEDAYAEQRPVEADETTDVSARPHPAAHAGGNDALSEAWERLERERAQLDVERAQLDEVAARIDRERARMDEVEAELAEERAELEALRDELDDLRHTLEARELNLEQERLRQEQGGPRSNAAESTQVVTDDQFIEIVDADKASSQDLAAADQTEVEPTAEASEAGVGDEEAERPTATRVSAIDASAVPAEFANLPIGSDTEAMVDVIDGQVLAACRLDRDRAEALCASEPRFFVQLHEPAGYPLLVLLLAQLDDRGQPRETFGWSLDLAQADDERIVLRLCDRVQLRVAIYDEAGELVGAYAVDAPLEDNVGWIRHRVEQRLSEPGAELGSAHEAQTRLRSEGYQRLGSMRHHFHAGSFDELHTPGDAKLAAGIVGYWSAPDMHDYLIANRSFPLDQFDQIQQRVVEGALDHGIYLTPALRAVALELGLVPDDASLVERLISNFAEVSLRIRHNDLDPLQEWDNWEALIDLAQEVGVSPDPDILELAEASLKRAQDYQEQLDAGMVAPGEPSPDLTPAGQAVVDQGATVVDAADLVVSKRSETTGVTYFLPDDAVLDTFDDLAAMSRDDLELLLSDPNGRLEAAQMLVERFGAEAVDAALEAAEEMSAPEVAALSRFFETRAAETTDEAFVAALRGALDPASPSTTVIAARALAAANDEVAIEPLVATFRDPGFRGDRRTVARALAVFGQAVVPELTRALEHDGGGEEMMLLVTELGRRHRGLLDELAHDQREPVRQAAEQARKRL